MKKQSITKRIIGRKEIISLPDFGIEDVSAKIDTGADGSCIHCHHIKLVKKNGVPVLTFDLLDPSHPQYEQTTFKAKKYSVKSVKSSSGHSEKRYVIKARLEIFGELFDTEFSLTDRSKMKYPILLGKRFLRNRFVVDVAKYNVSQKTLKNQG